MYLFLKVQMAKLIGLKADIISLWKRDLQEVFRNHYVDSDQFCSRRYSQPTTCTTTGKKKKKSLGSSVNASGRGTIPAVWSSSSRKWQSRKVLGCSNESVSPYIQLLCKSLRDSVINAYRKLTAYSSFHPTLHTSSDKYLK